MPTMNELNEAVYRGRFEDQMSKGADAAKKSMSELGDAVVITDEKVKKAEKSFGQIERRYSESARLTANLAKATREYEAAVKTTTAAVEAGARTQAEADEIIRRATLVRDAAFDKAVASAQKQKALYAELEQLAGRGSAAYQKWAEATRVATQAQDRFNQQLGLRLPEALNYDKRAEDIRAYGRGLDELRARITPLYAAELQFKDSVDQVNHALKVGAISTVEATMATERYRVVLENTARAATAASQASFNRNAGITLPDAAQSASRADDIRAYGRALDELRATFNPLYAAELRFQDAQSGVNRAVKAGALSIGEAKNALAAFHQQLQQTQNSLTQASQMKFNNLAGITLPDDARSASRAEDMMALGRAMDATRAKYVPLVAEMQRYEREMKEVREAEKFGVLTAQEAAAARSRISANYAEASKVATATGEAHARMGRQVHLTSNQLVQLSYQLNDVIAQSAVGTSPFIILAQQGPQVAQALGGWTASLRLLLGVLNPVTIAAAALVAAIAIPVAVANSNEARLSSMRNALRAYREDYRQTAEYLNGETRRIALASPGFGLGDVTDSAKTIERARVVSQLTTPLAELTRLAQDLSKTLDTDLASASERVARAMRDPAAVAKELAEQGFPGVTEALRRQIEVLQRAGERQQAFTALQNAMNEAVRGAARDVSPLAAAWDNLTKTFSEFWEMMRPALELVGTGIIVWVRSFLGYMERIRDIVREIVDLGGSGNRSTSGQSLTTTQGSAWDPPGRAPSGDLRDVISYLETGGEASPYSARNRLGFVGRYQFGTAALHDTGIYQRSPDDVGFRGTPVNAWSGRWNYPGVNSLDDFLGTPAGQAAQDEAFNRYIARLNAVIDRLGLLENNPAVNGVPVTREALLAVGWGRPTNMAALVRGQPTTDAPGDLPALTRFLMASRVSGTPGTEQYGPALPAGTAAALAGQSLAQIDEMVRRARGEYGGNQQGDTRQNAAANMAGFTQARQRLEEQNQALREQMEGLDQTSDRWRALNDQLTTNNASIETLNNGMDGARAAMTMTLDPVQQLIRGWENAADAARDTGSGSAFVRDRLRELDETSMRYRGTAATVEERHRATTLALSEMDAAYRNTNAQLTRQIDANNRVAASAAQGAVAMSQQEAVERAREEVRKTTLAGTAAEAEAIAALAQRYIQLQTAETERQTARRTVDRAQELEQIQREVDLIGASADRRERELAALKERQAILRSDPNADLSSDVNRRAISAAEGLATARVEADRLQASFNELANFGARAFDRIGSAITEAFANGTMSTIKWGNIARAVLSEMIQMAIRLALINPMMNWAFGQNNPTALSALQSTGSMFQGNPLGGGGGGISSLLGGGGFSPSSITSLFSSSGTSGGWFSGFGGLLGGTAATPAISSLPALPTAGSIAGTVPSAGLTIGGAGLTSWAGGIVGGYMIGSQIGDMVAKTEAQRTNSQIGAGGGAIAGAAIGTAIFPGVGTVIGGLLGGALGGGGGGLIGPSREFKGGDVGVGVNADGALIITGAGGKRWDEWGARSETQSWLDQVNAVMGASGVSIKGAGGFNWDRAGGAQTLGFDGSGQSGNVFGPSEAFARVRGNLTGANDTVSALLEQSFIRSWEDLAKTGPYAVMGNKNLATALRSGGIRSVDDVGSAAEWISGIYEPLGKAEEQASTWNDRIKAIHDTFLPAIETAQRYGLATDGLTARMDEAVRIFHEDHTLMMKDITDSLAVRQLTAQASLEEDPLKKIALSRQAALIQFDAAAIKQRKELEASLKDLYLNVWNPAEYDRLLLEQDSVAAQERLALWKQYQDQITQLEEQKLEEEKQKLEQAQQSMISVITGLADYAAGLRAGDMSPLSPKGRLDAAEAQFDEVYGKARNGDFRSLSRLQGVSDQYLSLAREVYGGGIGYSQVFDEIVQALEGVTTVDEDTLTASAMAAIMQDTAATLKEELERLTDTVQKLYTETRQNNLAPTGA